jgi:hypothetical protein
MTGAIEGDLEDIESWLTGYGPEHCRMREGLFTIKDDPHDDKDYPCCFCAGIVGGTGDSADSRRRDIDYPTEVLIYNDQGRIIRTEYID